MGSLNQKVYRIYQNSNMLFKLISVSSLAIVFSDYAHMKSLLRRVTVKSLKRMHKGRPVNGYEHANENDLVDGITLEETKNFGCWCYDFGSEPEWQKGQGPVKNELDALCKMLTESYRGIKREAEQVQNDIMEDCKFPSHVGYNFDIDHHMEIDCQTKNSYCKTKICEAEAEFIKSYAALVTTQSFDDIYKTDLKHEYFDSVKECVSTKIDTVNDAGQLKIFLKMAHPLSPDVIETQDVQWEFPEGNLFLKENIFS